MSERFSVDDFVVGEGQDEIFGEGVEHGEGQLAVMELAMDGILGEVLQGVMHPPHVPFEGEAQAADVGGTRDGGPGGGFLGDGQRAGMAGVDELR